MGELTPILIFITIKILILKIIYNEKERKKST
jgi:hypothetical protein